MKHIHFIGIGGSGLSAIARLLLESGYTVSGSDRVLTPFANEVRHAGAAVYIGHHPRNLVGADGVVVSSAIGADNPEVVAAKRSKIPVYKRAEFLGQLMADKKGIAIAGTILYYMAVAGYPFEKVISPPTDPAVVDTVNQMMLYMPPQLLGEPGIYFAIILAFIFVLVVYI